MLAYILFILAVAGAGASYKVVGSTTVLYEQAVWVPELYVDESTPLYGSFVDQKNHVTTVALQCPSGNSDVICNVINVLTVTWGSLTAGYEFVASETNDGNTTWPLMSAESVDCKVHIWSATSCTGTYTRASEGVTQYIKSDGVVFNYNSFTMVGVSITADRRWGHTPTSTPHDRPLPGGTFTTPSATFGVGDDEDGGSKPSAGVIAGAVVGSVIFLLLLLSLEIFWRRARRKRLAEDQPAPLDEFAGGHATSSASLDEAPPPYEAAVHGKVVQT